MNPFFSVIIPLYNKEDYIEDTLKSVLNQTFQDFEVIIVNDGSTDNSLEKTKSFTDSRISIFSIKNQGVSVARNFGIKKAKSDYIALIDADDLWAKDFLETIYKLIKHYNSKSIFTTAFKTFKTNKNVKPILNDFNIESAITISNFTELSEILVIIGAMVIHKKVFEKVGFFNKDINYAEDEDFYLRAFFNDKNFNLIFYNQPKAFYRIWTLNQLTSPNKNFKRNIPDFESYLTPNNKQDLKPYLDAIHYKLIILYKMERNKERVNFYKKKISPKNISFIKRVKFYLPINLFYYSKLFYIWFSNNFTHS